MLGEGGLDPTFVIGGQLLAAGANARLGGGQWLVAEADESDGSFLRLNPAVAIVTNIDADHLENYGGDFANVQAAFAEFLHRLPFYGLAVLCIDDPEVAALAVDTPRHVMTYGFAAARRRARRGRGPGRRAHAFHPVPARRQPHAGDAGPAGPRTTCRTHWPPRPSAGSSASRRRRSRARWNASPASAAASTCWRRSPSPRGGEVIVVDDYGHHPKELEAVFAAARGGWPDKRLVVAFQPHRYSRTRDLFDEFAAVLSSVDALVLTEVYPAGEAPIAGADAKSLARAIRARGRIDPVVVGGAGELASVLPDVLQDGDLLLLMGAGDIGHAAQQTRRAWL